MALTPKEQSILDELDALDVANKIALDAVNDVALVSERIRVIVNTDTIVVPPPVGPIASFTYASANDPTYPRKMIFTGAPANCESFAWIWGDGKNETHPTPTTAKTYSVDGTYTVTLTVTDANGLSGFVTQQVVVKFATTPPITPPTTPPDEVYAKPPAIYITSTRPTVTGKTIDVPVGGNVQAALDSAQPGDEVTFDNSGKYVGNFMFPQKTGSNGWVTLRPRNMGVLPAPGVRRTTAVGAPIFQSPNNQGVFATAPGAARYWIIGIEGTMPSNIANTGFIRLGASETTLSALPRQFVLEQVYLHGTPTGIMRRAVTLNGVDMSVLDSLITEMHDKGPDSQAIAGWNGPGPFRIINCGLSSASENVIFGGTDPSIAGLIPSDIEIHRCHMWKNPNWIGQGWAIKNLFELKNARRILVEACVMENSWADGQVGYATVLKSVNQEQTAPWSCTQDAMLRYNIMRNCGAGFNFAGLDVGATVPMERITYMHNLMDGFFPEAGTPGPNGLRYTGDGRGVQVLNEPIDLELIHNTILSPWNSSISFDGKPPKRMVYRDNIAGNGKYGVKGPGMNTRDTFAKYLADGKYKGNVLINLPEDQTAYPSGNYFAATEADVGFIGGTNRRLAASSKYKGKGTDGTDPGADIDKIAAMTAGVVGPTT